MFKLNLAEYVSEFKEDIDSLRTQSLSLIGCALPTKMTSVPRCPYHCQKGYLYFLQLSELKLY